MIVIWSMFLLIVLGYASIFLNQLAYTPPIVVEERIQGSIKVVKISPNPPQKEVKGDEGFPSSTKWNETKLLDKNDVIFSGKNETHMVIDNVAKNFKADNCTPPAILSFPPDLYNQFERQSGAVWIHLMASIYLFYVIAIICDDYYVPSIEVLCGALNLPRDVAGATFMAVAASSPELFTNAIGTFITKGDVGVGTIVGSAAFNILAVCTFCGFAAGGWGDEEGGGKNLLKLDWYPLARDCVLYSLAVILLISVLGDGRIYFVEALIFVLAYVVYIVVMWKNTFLRQAAEGLLEKIRAKYFPIDEDTVIVTETDIYIVTCAGGDKMENYEEKEEENCVIVCQPPIGQGWLAWLDWVAGWPARLIFGLTVPDCKVSGLRFLYPVTLIMCMIHIGILTYLATWLLTVVGHTFQIPDSIMGLTLIAAGNSLPEMVSSIIVSRQGHGSMSISNSIGSNTFDILICLGLPWLLRTIVMMTTTTTQMKSDGINFIQINSGGLEYSAIFLLTMVPFLFLLLALNKFYLDRKVAMVTLVTYLIFLVLASLLELNVFFVVNLPTCVIGGE